ncbi:hypothetical protein COW36_13480 [bacterium (Candidatus Blackallbacteria) CG17_big_fil_post_rev_8_21_14_2_50_48_46]|uniref:Uncharacterized protein n=1 Tax=bacterium (Candidatus Blackallbacteria) CG17_big_fil_post_rev_8_21_14_2_50_48_46 TaxID=2014261 RepID=A0A2M7G3B8_9BACT|nr:MAG: hypothetical protein COW64_22100 [bacterium (Candidatus Blackallbacteria) CG18_big_fil_WC_8_21_14_2_50_49_26]PIW16336.1 MAG: hypothetical protein COW36_13480 [bacterium (Candidatus Blackallbacteria) CG17_big_fil_post_rev_8_21_14_2_50_48_46]PIW45350.1 MAG: hypothetical protein COW20_20715 [bacterium (Candidatus Blackallbacteria) CG13_big_fil_rev_8_21_14_2_50_49_14]
MSENCQAVIGFLIPRQACKNLAETHCENCKIPICAKHTQIDSSGALCPVCALPYDLKHFKLNEQIRFSAEDLEQFSEAWRKQKGQQGGWVDFT